MAERCDCNPLDKPVRTIDDGWVLRDGRLYLFVFCKEHNVTKTVFIERSH